MFKSCTVTLSFRTSSFSFSFSWLHVSLQGCFLSPWPAAAPKRSPVRTRCWPGCRPTDRTSATSWWTSCWVWWCCWWSPVDAKQQSCWRSRRWISAGEETSSEVLRTVPRLAETELHSHDEQSFRFIRGQSSIVTPFIPEWICDAGPDVSQRAHTDESDYN